MRIVWLLLAGVVGGVLGGMGLGGGTLLIPILIFLLDVPYPLAAWVNLVAFLPTALVAGVLHAKNKMVEWKRVGVLLVFAAVGVLGGFFLAPALSETVIRRAFGIFLIVFGSCSLIFVFVGYFKKKHDKRNILH